MYIEKLEADSFGVPDAGLRGYGWLARPLAGAGHRFTGDPARRRSYLTREAAASAAARLRKRGVFVEVVETLPKGLLS